MNHHLPFSLEFSLCDTTFDMQKMYHHQHHHQGHNNILSSRTAFPAEKHLLLQGGSIPEDSGLVLSTDAKPRLKWTAELHERFIEAVNQLGGADSEYIIINNNNNNIIINNNNNKKEGRIQHKRSHPMANACCILG